MTRREIAARIRRLKDALATSRSECPMDYADWRSELRELEQRAKAGAQ